MRAVAFLVLAVSPAVAAADIKIPDRKWSPEIGAIAHLKKGTAGYADPEDCRNGVRATELPAGAEVKIVDVIEGVVATETTRTPPYETVIRGPIAWQIEHEKRLFWVDSYHFETPTLTLQVDVGDTVTARKGEWVATSADVLRNIRNYDEEQKREAARGGHTLLLSKDTQFQVVGADEASSLLRVKFKTGRDRGQVVVIDPESLRFPEAEKEPGRRKD